MSKATKQGRPRLFSEPAGCQFTTEAKTKFRLERMARERGMSFSALVGMIIREWMKENR